MEENKNEEQIEILEEQPTNDEVKKSNNKNSVILIFAVLGGLLFMLLIIVCIVILPGLIGSGKTNTKKASTDVEEKYSVYRMTTNALDKFDIAFLKFENNGKNKVYSPISIKYALAMLSEGSAENSKTQITNLIGDYKSNKYINTDHMSFANAVFIRNTFKDQVKEEYINSLKEKYTAEVIYDEFSSPANMNKWVSDKTFGLINNLFGDEVKNEDFELTNALAIDMKWNYQIQCASGSDVPCLRYSVGYRHEKIKGQDYQYNDSVVMMTSEMIIIH